MDASQAGQLLMVGFTPQELGEVKSLATQGRLGGVILFQRNATSAKEAADITKSLLIPGKRRPSLIVAMDQEQGRVCRIREGMTLFPGPSQLGLLNRPATTRRVARWVALELALLGVHLNLAPVADLPETVPWPPILEGRAFGRDPVNAARHVAAWVRGSQRAGVASCVKHFPGHGSVPGDTHREIQEDHSEMEKILRRHLVPFGAAFKAGVACVMLSHVLYPALDPSAPASLSGPVVRGLLRVRMGFQGLVLTDDLDMGAVACRLSAPDAVLEAICAGADMALVGRNMRTGPSITSLVEEVEKAVRGRHIPPKQVGESVRKVKAFKALWASEVPRPGSQIPCKAAARLAGRLFREVSLWPMS
jgi:beta-N-acetylhexosaminidase